MTHAAFITFVLILIGVVLIFASGLGVKLPKDKPVDLFKLGWGFILTGLLLVGRALVL